MNTYFNLEMTADEAKALYRKLAVELHPDKNSDKDGAHLAFIKLNNEYEAYLKAKLCYTSKQASDETSVMDEFIKANEFIKNFIGCTIEVTGSWIWICGNTFHYREQLKEKGFSYSGTKKRWYKSPEGTPKTKRRSGTNFDKIKATYGYDSVTIKDTTMKLK